MSLRQSGAYPNPAHAARARPPEVFDYRLGNRCALEWGIDQYRVTADKRTGIRSDPNNPDDPVCIVLLLAQLVPLNPPIP